MNFKHTSIFVLRIILFPVSCLYGAVIYIRNFLFDKGLLSSRSFPLPVICVGNLSVGGTGKTPMVIYIIALLKGHFNVATLSRGYRRKSSGFVRAATDTTPADIGDEPSLFHAKFPGTTVAAGEKRAAAIEQLTALQPSLQAIILDDAFQHRKVKAGLNILLTSYQRLFTGDYFLPSGELRDQRSSYRRAQVIVVTKCPQGLSVQEKNNIITAINPQPYQEVFFTSIQYGNPYHISTREELILNGEYSLLLVHGIAKPGPLQQYTSRFDEHFTEIRYPDHHDFSAADISGIIRKFDKIKGRKKIIITTEKDAVKIKPFKNQLTQLPLYVLPIECNFLFDERERFDSLVNTFVQQFNKNIHGS